MDVVHHAAIGGVGLLAASQGGHELAGIGFLFGSVLPDLDVAFMAAGKRFYLKRHQGPTHSAPLAPVYAGLITALASLHLGWSWELFFGVLAGLLAHVLLDLTNTFGIQILWPVSPRRHCLDAVFFVDLGAWSLTVAFYVVALTGLADAGRAAAVYAIVFTLYLTARIVLHGRAARKAQATILIPSSWNPWSYFALRRVADGVQTWRYDALRDRTSDLREVAQARDEVLALAGTSPIYRDLHSILRGLHVTSVERDDAGTRLVAHDLAIRNFGGRFGRTELRFDPEGRLVHEMANI